MTHLTRNVVRIIAIILGVIIGSLVSVETTIAPNKVDYITNKNIKVEIRNKGDRDTFSLENKTMLPIHNQEGELYFSPTLSLDDLTLDGVDENLVYDFFDLALDRQVDNIVTQAELIINGDSTLNKAIRVMFQVNGVNYIVSQESPCIVLENAVLTKDTVTTVRVWIYYELEDDSVTIENINNASSSDIKINFYAYQK